MGNISQFEFLRIKSLEEVLETTELLEFMNLEDRWGDFNNYQKWPSPIFEALKRFLGDLRDKKRQLIWRKFHKECGTTWHFQFERFIREHLRTENPQKEQFSTGYQMIFQMTTDMMKLQVSTIV